MTAITFILKLLKLVLPFVWSMFRSHGVVRVVRENWFAFFSIGTITTLSIIVVVLSKERISNPCINPTPATMVSPRKSLERNERESLNALLKDEA